MDNKTKYDLVYAKKNVKQIKMNLNLNTDTDIIEWLDTQQNKQGYLKELIRADMKKQKRKSNKFKGEI